jgi:hypothetical protein
MLSPAPPCLAAPRAAQVTLWNTNTAGDAFNHGLLGDWFSVVRVIKADRANSDYKVLNCAGKKVGARALCRRCSGLALTGLDVLWQGCWCSLAAACKHTVPRLRVALPASSTDWLHLWCVFLRVCHRPPHR